MTPITQLVLTVLFATVIINVFADSRPAPVSPTMKLTNPQFKTLSHSRVLTDKYTPARGDENSYIPIRYSCKGSDISPQLDIEGIPDDTKSLVLIMDDPDAPSGMFVHWVVWNIPPDTELISEGESPPGIQGMTDFHKRGYGGPCPPSDIHRYYFKLYALDTTLDISTNSTKKDVESAMQGHIIEKAELIGLFKR